MTYVTMVSEHNTTITHLSAGEGKNLLTIVRLVKYVRRRRSVVTNTSDFNRIEFTRIYI